MLRPREWSYFLMERVRAVQAKDDYLLQEMVRRDVETGRSQKERGF